MLHILTTEQEGGSESKTEASSFSPDRVGVSLEAKNMSGLQLNIVLLDISNQLTAGQLEDIKFLCKDVIGKRELEKISSGTKLFQLLAERGRLGADNTEYLAQFLREVQRHDLSDKLNGVQSPGVSEQLPDEAERAKLDIATEVIAENLGKNWRRLARKLHFPDVKVDSISRRYPTELEETARELLKEWRKSRGREAQTMELMKALRDCKLNLIADNIEDRLSPP